MKITPVVVLFALFGHTSARLNADSVEQDQRALENGNGNGNGNGNNGNGNGNGNSNGNGNGNTGNGNGNNGNGNGNGGGAGEDAGEFSQFDVSRPLVELPQTVTPPESPPLVSDFAAGNDDDEVDILVTYKNNNGKAKAKRKAKKINQELRLGNIVAMRATKQEIRKLARDADVETIDLDTLVFPSASAPLYLKEYFAAPDDMSYEYASYGVPFTQSDSTVIPSSTTMGDCSNPSTFKVAIIDSGYMVNHPDSPCLTETDGKTNCIGYSFVADPWDAPARNAHGTHVMGIIGSLGGSGPFTNIGVMPTRNDICYVIYRVFAESGGGASWSSIFAAVDSAVLDHGAKVINLSLGGGKVWIGQAYFNRAYAAGTLTVAASGNSGRVVDMYPASYDGVISVGAINNDKYWASFYNSLGQWTGGSNCNTNLDVCAPGFKIWSTITKVGSFGSKYGLNDEYSGTSMAAPHVTGVIAKIWSQCPACSHVEVETCLKTTAEYVGPSPICYGSGLVQAEDAYICLTNTCC